MGVERIIGDIARASPIDGPGVVNGKVVNLSTSPGANNPFASLLFPNSAGGVRRGYRNYINGLLRFDYDLGFITRGLAVHGNVAVQTYNDQLITNTKVLITYTAYKLRMVLLIMCLVIRNRCLGLTRRVRTIAE